VRYPRQRILLGGASQAPQNPDVMHALGPWCREGGWCGAGTHGG